ncbi:MAG: DNA polymerase III subunit beta [Chromatiales bacterium]|jgi:DNA polymerase-3 subunit beta
MKIRTDRDELLKPLQRIGGVVERRQTLPILANVLIAATAERVELTATDLEVELRTGAPAEVSEEFEFTLPARKLMDICKALPEGAPIELSVEGERAVLRSGRSRFTLGLLPAADFPAIEPTAPSQRLRIAEGDLKRLIERTYFAMAQQDVRYYLNGMLLEAGAGRVRAVATDGHRLALSEGKLPGDQEGAEVQVILPRKAVLELGRLLADTDAQVELEISSNHVRMRFGEESFTTKLIDGRFPDYERVIPRDANKLVKVERDGFRHALARASILSNEKYRGIRFNISDGVLQLQAHNPEQEEAEEEIEVDYHGEELVIGFNVSYLLDVLGVLTADTVDLALRDSNSSCLISAEGDDGSRYVVMPMRL